MAPQLNREEVRWCRVAYKANMVDLKGLSLRLAPALFVFLWSTGWISARAAAPHADPLTFLAVRYALAGVAMAVLCWSLGAVWPKTRAARGHALVSGVLLHAAYLGPVWYAVAQGVPAGVSGVLAGSQPLLTALLAQVLIGERISRWQWAGIGVGFAGILLVLQPKLSAIDTAQLSVLRWALAINALGMISVTLGTFYQKRFLPSGDLRTLAAWQYIGAAAATLPVAYWTETMRLEWNWASVLTMAWAVIAISLGAILMLLWLIRSGAVARAAALIYLVPAAVVLEAWLLFGETVTPLQIAGVMVTALGVALAVRK
jgi:drug/metabolite transporter (DMT)-like permease